MSEFINTVDVLGDVATFKAIMDNTITEFRDNKLTYLRTYAFAYCDKLTLVDLPACTTIGNTPFNAVGKQLTHISMPALTKSGYMGFRNCSGVQSLYFPNMISVEIYSFQNCTALMNIDIGNKLNGVAGSAFNGCTALTSVIIRRSDGIPSLQNATDVFKNTPIASGTGYIYVPRALVDSYKTATNWTTYATQFRALEDYTVDGTITGALDESKI